jgi:hypothetical protein
MANTNVTNHFIYYQLNIFWTQYSAARDEKEHLQPNISLLHNAGADPQ